MNTPSKITVTATVAAWMSNHNNPTDLLDSVKAGRAVEAIGSLVFYGAPDKGKFADWIRVGEADVTVSLLPLDDQVRMAVQALQRELDAARAEWMTKQQEILERISKLQALEYVEAQPEAQLAEEA